MDFDKTFELVTRHAEALKLRLDAVSSKGTPSLQLQAMHDLKSTFGDGQWKLSAGVQGRVALSVFTGKDDVDPDGIFGITRRSSLKPGAVLVPTSGRAWTKLELSGDVSGKLGRARSAAKVEFSGKRRVALGAYTPSDDTLTLQQALRAYPPIPFVLDADDVRQLLPGQVAYVAMDGTFKAKLQFNWADLLTGSITPLHGLVEMDRPVNLVVDLKAGLTASLAIADAFRLVFVGIDSDCIGVALNRTASSTLAVDAGAQATVRLDRPDIARDVLASLAAQLLGVAPERIGEVRAQLEKLLGFYDAALEQLRSGVDGLGAKLDAFIGAQGLPSLATRLRQLQMLVALGASDAHAASAPTLTIAQAVRVTAIIDGLGDRIAAQLGGSLDSLVSALKLPALATDATRAVRTLLERVEKIESALLDMARKRIERGLDFEYRRLSTDATVLKAQLLRSHPEFDDLHRSLLALDASVLLEACEPTNRNVVLELLLNQKSVKRSLSLGLDLGGFYAETDKSALQWAESTRTVSGKADDAPLQVDRRMTLIGSRSREEKVFGTPAMCSGQFDAEFRASGHSGSAGRWRFALSLSYASQVRRADRHWLLAVADYACVWGVIDESRIEWLLDTLEADGAIGQQVAIEVGLDLGNEVFENAAFLTALRDVSDLQLSEALAVALQRMQQFPQRATPESRVAAYADAMTVLLGRGGVDVNRPDAVARSIARKLRSAPPELKRFESEIRRPIPAGSVASMVQHTGSVLGHVREFRQAGALLALAGVDTHGSSGERRIVEDAYRGMDLAWRDRFLLRWQVSLLRTLAVQAGAEAAVNSTLKVTVGAGTVARIISRPR